MCVGWFLVRSRVRVFFVLDATIVMLGLLIVRSHSFKQISAKAYVYSIAESSFYYEFIRLFAMNEVHV